MVVGLVVPERLAVSPRILFTCRAEKVLIDFVIFDISAFGEIKM
jgi:hypothetical protein